MEKITAHLISDKIFSNSAEAQNLFSKSRFGEKTDGKIYYTLTEALFLFEDGKLEVLDSRGKKIQKENLIKRFQRINKKFQINYQVFKDLRKKGYIVKSALKFGSDFRIYEKGTQISKDHSKWLCFTTSENENLKWSEFSSKNRVAHSTKKNLLIAVVDEENDVTYFEVSWIKT